MVESRLDKPREWTGHWWLPDWPDLKVPGVLTYDPMAGLRLALIGGFDHHVTRVYEDGSVGYLDETRSWGVIHGLAARTSVTLLDCYLVSVNGSLFPSHEPEKQTVGAQLAVSGLHLDSPDDAVFTKAFVLVEELTTWANESVFTGRLHRENEKLTGQAELIVEPVSERSVDLDGFTVALVHTHTMPHFVNQRGRSVGSMEEQTFIRYAPKKPWTLDEALCHASAIQDLISLASHRACAQLSISLRVPPEDLDYPEGYPVRDRHIDVYKCDLLEADRDSESVDRYGALFTCEDIPFEQVIRTWYEIRDDCEAAANMVLALRYAPPGYLETALISAVGAAEVMHRALKIDEPPMPNEEFKTVRSQLLEHVASHRKKWFKETLGRNDPTLRNRLIALAKQPDSTSMTSLVPSPVQWAASTTRARNDLAHEGRSRRHSINELVAIVDVTTAVVVMNLMQKLGLPAGRQQQIVIDNPHLRRAAKQAARWFTKANET